ncbi:na+-driven multidrug efflux pump [Stylonychia lemnae]|uniref:Na+-driven multidrug efflux pump n=1 Tax=Stylonychia lemnae TaxID=5949 RepID=A0A078A900_STYLE|nr:na+-driven multidrug efflux pump [Stylonychia lemnae]|eukprot:CDW78027.1 na+-driven multidrug efflux pump [Stylonychia lemnae]
MYKASINNTKDGGEFTSDLKEPLLQGGQGQKNDMEKARKQDSSEHENLETWHVLKKISQLSIFPIIGMIFHPAYSIFNAIVLGQNEDGRILASLGLGSLTLGIVLLSIGSSFNSCLDTLISQAFGQKDHRLCILYLNRQFYLSTMVFLPLAIIVYQCETFYVYLGQDPFVAKNASTYVLFNIPGILFATYGSCYSRYFSGNRYTKADMFSKIGASLVHFGLCYYLAVKRDMGMFGVAVSTSFHFFCRFLILFLFFKLKSQFNSQNVSLFHRENFRNLGHQIKLSFQCASFSIWSWWAFDIFTLIASYMSVSELAAQTILRNIGLLTYMIPVGIAQASSITVGNNIGSKNIQTGMVYAKMCVLTSVIWAAGTVIFLNAMQGTVISVFSNSSEVNSILAKSFPIISVFVFFDCVQGVGQGIIRGLGKQGRASIITIIGYWGIGIPTSLLCVFYLDWGIVGLWVGPSLAIIFNFIFYYIIIIKADWFTIALEAEQRRFREKNQ